ncbi:MAG: EthD domain-containing protein, partial [Ilumatobacteraceae bacterium]|nr:EthD domain-containing protein [Ilumatobacteraceae bacterium]
MKAVILLTRREDMTHEEFVSWWLGQHRALASRLPGLRR